LISSHLAWGALAITGAFIRDVARFTDGRAPVTSCYLDVDGRRYIRPQDLEPHLDALLRKGRRKLAPDADRTAQASVETDLRRISDLVRGGIDRSSTRGLVIFSCSAAGFWQVVELAVPVPNMVVVAPTPHIRVLESILEHNLRFAVLLADRQRARLFLFELGRLVERQEHFDQLPRHDDDGGHWRKDQVAGHAAVAAARHVRRAARATFAFYQAQAFDHLVLGAPHDLARELETELHPWLRERVVARLSVPVAARDDEIVSTALEVAATVEAAREAALVERLRRALGSGNGAVAGIAGVLDALVARRAETLLVSEGYEASGWRCRGCAFVAVRGRRCPVCEADMEPVEDVVEEAVQEGLAQSCRLAMCRDNADLDVLGRIAALVRY
jgi:peptide chain release factor subunit 1